MLTTTGSLTTTINTILKELKVSQSVVDSYEKKTLVHVTTTITIYMINVRLVVCGQRLVSIRQQRAVHYETGPNVRHI